VSLVLFCGFDGFDVMGKDEKEKLKSEMEVMRKREKVILYTEKGLEQTVGVGE
jgi:hypothetical protein